MFSSAQDAWVNDKIARVGVSHHFTLVPTFFFPPPFSVIFYHFGFKIFSPRLGCIFVFFLILQVTFLKWTIALDTHWRFSSARADIKEDIHLRNVSHTGAETDAKVNNGESALFGQFECWYCYREILRVIFLFKLQPSSLSCAVPR